MGKTIFHNVEIKTEFFKKNINLNTTINKSYISSLWYYYEINLTSQTPEIYCQENIQFVMEYK